MIRTHPSTPPAARQNGAALVTGLIFVVVLTIIGITAARMASLEERMAGNMRDRALAMQAAELALRDAERDILGLGTAPRSPAISGISSFNATCQAGLCYNGTGGFTTPVWLSFSMTGTPSVAYGTFSGAAAIPLVDDPPRYLIEGFRKQAPGSGGDTFFYRITVRAVGANANTVVWLQEVFKP
ncbi:MAG TPA: PilX N-terminal domain-containing pilus assembly protein [Thiobacillaceae bacterium]|nr:PilX N-terminal domain-containing pilus assembly protein [Thiobacillaceae bacterium]HNU65226.1 PilX N-terminal domain-containing pilus assembly protein [Thiobacillaceae bacterium]